MSSSWSDSQEQDRDSEEVDHKLFQYDCYLSDSIDVFAEWNQVVAKLSVKDYLEQTREYLKMEYPAIRSACFIRSARIVRCNAFIYQLKLAFEQLQHCYHKLFNQHGQIITSISDSLNSKQKLTQVQQSVQSILSSKQSLQQYSLQQAREPAQGQSLNANHRIKTILQQSQCFDIILFEFLDYLHNIIETKMSNFYEQVHPDFLENIAHQLQKIFYFVVSPYGLWRILTTSTRRMDQQVNHIYNISLGGNLAYYKNNLRQLSGRNIRLQTILESLDLQNIEKVRDDYNGSLLVQALLKMQHEDELGKFETKDKMNFITAVKGLYYERRQTRKVDLFHEYLFASLHIDYLWNDKKYIDYEYLQKLFINVLKKAIIAPQYLKIAMYIEIRFVQIEKRPQSATIQSIVMELMTNFIGTMKNVVNIKGFKRVPIIAQDKVYESTVALYDPSKLVVLVELLVELQWQSKQAFSYGDIVVHQVYLEMAKILREMYLSFMEEEWILPSDILSQLGLKFFIRISEDIKAEVKAAIYQMVTILNDDKMPKKVIWVDAKLLKVDVTRQQYLMVLLSYLQDCSREEQFINLPQIMPVNIQTGILYVKSLQLKLKGRQPNAQQQPYYTLLLQQCERMKIKIDFSWYHVKQTSSDRQLQFNIIKDIREQWMRNIVRECLNYRDKENMDKLFESNEKSNAGIVGVANLLKYNQGLCPSNIDGKVGDEECFGLMDEMRNMLSIYLGDIFQLSLDDEVNLNYLHLCLGFYNSRIKEAVDSDIYPLIMERIMVPYLRAPLAKSKGFMDNYLNFFKKWIYAAQMPLLLQQLASNILQHQCIESERVGITYKMRLVYTLIDNKQALTTTVPIEQVAEMLGTFSSIFHSNMHPQILIQGVQIVTILLYLVPALKKDFSLQFILNTQVLQKKHFIKKALQHIRKQYKFKTYYSCLQSVSLLNYLLLNLHTYMHSIGLQLTMEVIQTYVELRQTNDDVNIQELSSIVLAMSKDCKSHLVIFLQFLFQIKKYNGNAKLNLRSLFEEGEQKLRNEEKQENMLIMKELLHRLKESPRQDNKFQHVKFTQIAFMQMILYELKDQQDNISSGREVFKQFLKYYGHSQDLMFFANKLHMSQLILAGGLKEQAKSQKEELILVDLIVEDYHKQAQTELIKTMLRENRALSKAAVAAVHQIQNQKRKVHIYHINRLIHINNRYPNEQVEKFILKYIGAQRNPSAVKISQPYLVNYLRSHLNTMPQHICYQMLLQPYEQKQFNELQAQISQLFHKLVYLPIKKFDGIDLNVVTERNAQQQTDQWHTESEGQDTKQIIPPDKIDQAKSQQIKHQADNSQINNSQHNSMQQQQDEQQQRVQFLDIFTQDDEDNREHLHRYFLYIHERELLDVYIESDYIRLNKEEVMNDPYVGQRMVGLVKLLEMLPTRLKQENCYRMPRELFNKLKLYGLTVEIDEQVQNRLAKRRNQITKLPDYIINRQLFSDREQRDEEDNQYDDEDQDDDDESNSDSGDDQQEHSSRYGRVRRDEDGHRMEKQRKNYKNKDQKQEEQQQLVVPKQLLPTNSKVESEIVGSELTAREMTKIMEIALYQLLVLPAAEIKTPQIISFYMDILESSLAEVFLESAITVIRFEEARVNIVAYLKILKQKRGDCAIGLQQISLDNAVINILGLLKQYQQVAQKKNLQNILLRQSGSLLPIATEMVTKFDLPIQNNSISLLFYCIETKRSKIKDAITDINYQSFNQSEKKQEHKLTTGELNRIIAEICQYKCNNKIWDIVEDIMHLKVKPITKLFACIKEYGNKLYERLSETGLRILKTIEKSQENNENLQGLHSLQGTYHVVSKLLLARKDEIKQFYFINKDIVSSMYKEDDQGSDNQKKLPKVLQKHQKQIMCNPQLINLTQLMIFFIKRLTDKFQGKIEDRMLTKLIHYPKMIIQNSWRYLVIFSKTSKYTWSVPAEAAAFFDKYKLGEYKFNNIQEVLNLVLNFLGLESFCSDRFKEVLLPVFMADSSIGVQVPLIFKTPGSDENIHTQNIVVTRKCSFDMSFFQLNGRGIHVEFYGEEGSDHGGLVRELMIGWKGKGIGQQSFFIGKILGISFSQSVPYGGAMDLPMLIGITQHKPTIQIFKDVDPELYNSLVYIRDNDPSCLCLSMSIEKEVLGVMREIQLILNGRNIDLTQQNKHIYLQKYPLASLMTGREKQMQELRAGFYSVVHPKYAQIFTPFEMLRQIRGEEIVDPKILQSKAKYDGYSEETPVIKWLWELLAQFDQEHMNKFIQFVTGSPKITVYNTNFQISIEKVHEVHLLPVAHTCFNTLDLPQYGSKQVLKKKLLVAIFQGNDTFGIL